MYTYFLVTEKLHAHLCFREGSIRINVSLLFNYTSVTSVTEDMKDIVNSTITTDLPSLIPNLSTEDAILTGHLLSLASLSIL